MNKSFLIAVLFLPLVAFSLTVNAQTTEVASEGSVWISKSLNLSNGYSVVSTNGRTYSMGDSVLLDCQLTASNNTANTSNTVVTVDTSDDDVTWQTGTFQMSLANTGTLATSVRSNFNTLAIGFLRFSISNGCVQTINTTNTAWLKVNKKLYN
jgi:hypothetical protein